MRRLAVFALLTACGGPGATDDLSSSRDELSHVTPSWTLSHLDPLSSLSAAATLAHKTVPGALAVRIEGTRVGGPDALHARPQPTSPRYSWTIAYANAKHACVVVTIGTGKKPVIGDQSVCGDIGYAPIKLSHVRYGVLDLAKLVATAVPDLAGNAFDGIRLYGDRVNAKGIVDQPQLWELDVYVVGNDDRIVEVNSNTGSAAEVSVD